MPYEIQSVHVRTSDGVKKPIRYDTSETPIGDGACVLHFRLDPESGSEPSRLEIVFKVPLAGIHGLWTPYRSSNVANQTSLNWSHDMHTVQGDKFPAMAFVDRELRPVLFISLTEHASETGWSANLSQSD